MDNLLEIKHLTVSVGEEKQRVLHSLSLSLEKGKVYAIMGPNGSGKSTLAKVLSGHPSYTIEEGEVWFQGENLLEMEPEERVHRGLFLGFQYPTEIEGISNRLFLRSCLNASRKFRDLPPLSEEEFLPLLQKIMDRLHVPSHFQERGVNAGFSGGEKKRNEILQMALLEPTLAILDETDSGLDIDAIRSVADNINQMRDPQRTLLLITHYQRLLDLVIPDVVFVLDRGTIVRTGTAQLALELEEKGYR